MEATTKQVLKDWRTWRDGFFACLILIIYNTGAIFASLTYYKTEKLWFPYIFGGMPSYSAGNIGVKWWNQIQVFIEATITTASTNPIMFAFFLITLAWMYKRYSEQKRVWLNYILVIFVEFFMIITTEWK